MMRHYPILPVSKPRQTQRDKRRYTAAEQRADSHAYMVERYRAFADEVRYRGVVLPKSGAWVVFFMPMPPSWSERKKVDHMWDGCESVPDYDNLAKALGDAVYGDDRSVWDVRNTKVWARWHGITILEDMDLHEPSAAFQEMKKLHINYWASEHAKRA